MSESDDDPWPGACCGRTGFVTRSYYTDRYTMTEPFCTFFGIDKRPRYTMYQIEGIVLDYIDANIGYTNKTVNYNESLWTLFGLSPNEPFKARQIDHYVRPFQRGERPCPICEQLRPFNPRIPNGLCQTCCCSPDLLDSKGEPATVEKRKWVPLSAGFFTHIEKPVETSFMLHGVSCRRPCYGDEILLEAIVYCPICATEVKEERRLGALCDRCARSEWLVDSNGNRVRFKPSIEDNYGYQVMSYENGEIIERTHIGEFPCFFQDVACVADDIGTRERVIVRFREPIKRTWLFHPPPMEGSFYSDGTETIAEQEEWIAATDWLDPGYPRWAMWKSESI